MYAESRGPLRPQRLDPACQVVVRLARGREARAVLQAAAGEGRLPARRGALLRLLASPGLLGLEPVFGDAPRGGDPFRRLALAAVREPEPALAGLAVLRFRSRREAGEACRRACADPLVEHAYVLPERRPLAARARAGADPLVNRQWGLRAIELFSAERAAGFPDPGAVRVAVVDSGVDSGHPDLEGVFAEERSFTGGPLRDQSGHGTHVCGILGARVNNRRGVRGILRGGRLLSLKALDPYSGPGYYRALRHAADSGARVLNLSLGGGPDPTEETLVRRAIRRGVVVVAAMGNEKEEGNPPSHPAAIPGVIAVGASTETDGIASFSSTGRHIDLVAPGVNVLSTVPTYPTSLAEGTDYEAWPGTSMAAPHVAAAAALCLARRPDASVAEVRRALVRGADRVPGQRGFDATFGHGRLNLRRALERMRARSSRR
jgi:hypothetical protein